MITQEEIATTTRMLQSYRVDVDNVIGDVLLHCVETGDYTYFRRKCKQAALDSIRSQRSERNGMQSYVTTVLQPGVDHLEKVSRHKTRQERRRESTKPRRTFVSDEERRERRRETQRAYWRRKHAA